MNFHSNGKAVPNAQRFFRGACSLSHPKKDLGIPRSKKTADYANETCHFFSNSNPRPSGSNRLRPTGDDKRAQRPAGKSSSEIEKQSGYVFFYDSNDLKKLNVSITLKNASIDQTLKECFIGLPLAYKIVESTVVIRKKEVVTPNLGKRRV